MRFRYLKDPLFLFCLAGYFINRLIIKPCIPNEFSRAYLNDLICLPFWIPIMLLLMRKSGLRKDDAPPTGSEILVPLIIWSWTFEVILPKREFFRGITFADHMDILCYAGGGLMAAIFWEVWYRRQSRMSG